jgi:hypothetical protein
MDNLFLIWAIATLPKLGLATIWLGIIGLSFSFAVSIGELIGPVGLTNNLKENYIYARTYKVIAPISLCFFVFGFLIPNQNNIIKAYLIVEGSKIITAENAEHTSTEIVNRIDVLMNTFSPENKQKEQEETSSRVGEVPLGVHLDEKAFESVMQLVRENNKNNQQ